MELYPRRNFNGNKFYPKVLYRFSKERIYKQLTLGIRIVGLRGDLFVLFFRISLICPLCEREISCSTYQSESSRAIVFFSSVFIWTTTFQAFYRFKKPNGNVWEFCFSHSHITSQHNAHPVALGCCWCCCCCFFALCEKFISSGVSTVYSA